ncbi:hypothetical protein BU24DRAFT_442470 [Aaosphaeria arxii CBS 175.79]|uniref:Uncharacterized protein n=1 Tax=Aaosphaeria arxii CBS 175.79 TaxID=1450172 RepID=A0A6A5XJB3_9PLEO|nr:uncharacterized protein BU24DRAFT_442470 [Aaosphaeria arxii CBS 175.79]KAF2013355.1 hypothetical protein BU24DRAFT_442470 [Aaosphaeria arxii CBS 175.79]
MSRPINLLIYNSPLFPAHWSLWLPSAADPNIGKRIHVTGDSAFGFETVFERNYNLAATRRRYQIVPLAQVLEHHVANDEGDSGPSSDNTARDYVEQVALSVPAPGPSLVSASSSGPRQRVAIQNCQTWLRELVVKLVEKGVMDQSAVEAIDKAPKN